MQCGEKLRKRLFVHFDKSEIWAALGGTILDLAIGSNARAKGNDYEEGSIFDSITDMSESIKHGDAIGIGASIIDLEETIREATSIDDSDKDDYDDYDDDYEYDEDDINETDSNTKSTAHLKSKAKSLKHQIKRLENKIRQMDKEIDRYKSGDRRIWKGAFYNSKDGLDRESYVDAKYQNDRKLDELREKRRDYRYDLDDLRMKFSDIESRIRDIT